MHRARLPYLLIPVAAFLAIIPLLTNGCSCGHDFDFHLLNWMEAARQFTHGNLHPHWAYTPAYNAGEPRFVFYPPLSWHLGAIFGLFFPWTWTPILYTWLALTAAGLALHRLARDFATPTAALIAAIVYTVNPYMLFTAYERTAYAELLAAAWIPLLLRAILRSNDKGGVTIPGVAIPIALLWLTNAPAAVMSCYALALLTTVRIFTTDPHPQDISTNPGTQSAVTDPPDPSWTTTEPGAPYLDSEMGTSRESRSPSSAFARGGEESATAPAHAQTTTTPTQTPLHIARNTIAGTALGLGLAAFYILPAAYERRYVQIAMAIIPNMRIQDNFLFHRTGDALHDQVLHTASIVAIILSVLTVVALAIATIQSQPKKEASSRPERSAVERPPHFVNYSTTSNSVPLLLPLTILTLAITLLLTPITTILWTHAPELAFLQFPWRLTAILAAILSLATSIALTRLNLKPTITATLTLTMAATLAYFAYRIFHQPCDEEDTVQARLARFHADQGTEPTDEYTPITADNDALAHTNPAYWLSPDPNAKAPANTSPGPAPTHLTVNAPAPEDLILNLRDYPAWRIKRNGTPITDRLQRDDGLLALPLPTGPSTIDVAYTQTTDQTLGNILSLASLAALALFLAHRSNK